MKIAFGMPLVGDLPSDAVQDHLRLAFSLGREAERSGHSVVFVCPQGVFPHDRARLEVFEEARRYECEKVFFVDADTLVPRDAFAELLKVQEQSGAPLVSGHYLRRGYPFTCVWSKLLNGEFSQVDAQEGIHELDTCGLGCALVDVLWVVKNLAEPYFTMELGPKCSIVTDDVAFCTRIRQAGGLILGHAGIQCIHLGNRQAICPETAPVLRRWYLNKNNPD